MHELVDEKARLDLDVQKEEGERLLEEKGLEGERLLEEKGLSRKRATL